MGRNDRNGHRRRALRRRVAMMGLPCALCGRPIDYTLPAGDDWSYELDEIVPFSLGGDELDPDNVQPTHRICNRRKGNRMLLFVDVDDPKEGEEAAPTIFVSQDWCS